jgi:hypothetical protein
MLSTHFPFFPSPSTGSNGKLRLSPNPLRVSAADSYRRARNALLAAQRNPATRDREMRSSDYWRRSAAYWRAQASLDSLFPIAAE